MTTEPLPQHLFAIDIGGSHITAAAVTLTDPPTVDQRAARDADPHGSADDILGAWAAACLDLEPAAGALWAVAMPDPFDFELGRGTFENVGKFEHLADVDLKGELAARLSTTPGNIQFVHDASAYGVGEYAFGEARGHDRAVCITLGTGVGSAFLDHGTPVSHRADVPTNGTVHLLTVAGGPLEDSVSTRAIVRAYNRMTGSTLDVKTIAERARGGETAARTVLDTAFSRLGAALGPWLVAFEATVLVIGGSMSRSWDLFEASFRAGMATEHAERAADIELRPSQLLDDAPLLGAATWLAHRTDPLAGA